MALPAGRETAWTLDGPVDVYVVGRGLDALRWAVFEISGLAAGRTSVAAVMERNPSVEELLAFLEDELGALEMPA